MRFPSLNSIDNTSNNCNKNRSDSDSDSLPLQRPRPPCQALLSPHARALMTTRLLTLSSPLLNHLPSPPLLDQAARGKTRLLPFSHPPPRLLHLWQQRHCPQQQQHPQAQRQRQSPLLMMLRVRMQRSHVVSARVPAVINVRRRKMNDIYSSVQQKPEDHARDDVERNTVTPV